ncbi:hypothetical protein ACFSX9_11685 [Flavobacterium ardleyense]|uniref:Lipoprotein n=1 Tax=Flavobacterium ardleyense TaxID=2038737 RepID=A0ABW5Z934_9FLAO
MKKYIGFLVLAIAFLNVSCDKCMEGDKAEPASLFVDLLDETTLENVFVNETFTAQQISIKDLEDKLIPFVFVSNMSLIRIFPDTQNPLENTFIITLNNDITDVVKEITITYDVEAIGQECYTTYKTENVQVPNNASEVIDGIYRIKI